MSSFKSLNVYEIYIFFFTPWAGAQSCTWRRQKMAVGILRRRASLHHYLCSALLFPSADVKAYVLRTKAEQIHMLIGAILPCINVASYLLQVQQVLGLWNLGCSLFIVWPMRLRTSWEFILLSLSASNSLETFNKTLFYLSNHTFKNVQKRFLCTLYCIKIHFIIYLIYYLIFFNFCGKCY